MKCVYEAANGVEAHMIANLLEQQQIATRIDGEYLAGAVGELPATGLVRVMAEETDYDRARTIIREWEAASPPASTVQPAGKSNAPMWFMAGVVATVAVVASLSKRDVTQDGIDFNNDGRIDEHYAYSGRHLSQMKGDRDLDGEIDIAVDYDSKGLPASSSEDNNFDGRFETKSVFERADIKRTDIDIDGDNSVDIRYDYVNGVMSTATYYEPNGYGVRKRERYDGGLLVSGELDTDGDNVLDTVVRYDRYGEAIDAMRK